MEGLKAPQVANTTASRDSTFNLTWVVRFSVLGEVIASFEKHESSL